MKYKILSVFLAVLVAFTFCIRSFANPLVLAISYVGFGITSALFAGIAGHDIVEAIDQAGKQEEVNGIVTSGGFNIVENDNGGLAFQYQDNSNYTDFQRSIQQSVCDQLNSKYSQSDIINSIKWTPDQGITFKASVYSDIKEATVSALRDSIAQHFIDSETGEPREFKLHQYDFDLSSGTSTINSEITYTPKEFSTEGFYFLSLNVAPASYSDWTSSEGAASNWNSQKVDSQWITVNGSSFPVYRGYVYSIDNSYGIGWCVIYNGKPYFMPIVNKSATPYNSGVKICSNIIPDNCINQFISADGESLSTAGCSTIVDCSYCPYYIIDPNVEGNYPMSELSDDNFYDITGGTSDAPLTNDESIVPAAIAAGLVSGDPEITLNPDGSIAAVDGISLETLANLINQLANDQIKFSDIESYLQYISTCLHTANVNTDTINRLLNNVKSFSERSADALDEINAAIPGIKQGIDDMTGDLSDIKDNIQTITDSLTDAKALELDKTYNNDMSIIIGNHTGLYEANEHVENWNIVNQLKGVMANLLNGSRYNNDPPNLSFYYDSDKDGVSEKYTAIDFSFLETPLTNENLEDKTHFQNTMTVREFIQSLLILVCYAAFTIKVLRKLPGLVSGGESAAGDGLELKSITTKSTNGDISK